MGAVPPHDEKVRHLSEKITGGDEADILLVAAGGMWLLL